MDPDPYMEALNKFGLPWKVVENPVPVDCYKTADPSVHMD
jgi:saccharopine dehydrogenase (NAD+, L-lysine-forming)